MVFWRILFWGVGLLFIFLGSFLKRLGLRSEILFMLNVLPGVWYRKVGSFIKPLFCACEIRPAKLSLFLETLVFLES